MITVGVDVHKRLHVATAVDGTGREIGTWKGANTVLGWDAFWSWLKTFEAPRRVGIEGAWNYGRGLAQYLVEQDVTVYEVNSRWTALGRRTARRQGKSDRLDSTAVALFVVRAADTLNPIARDDETAILNLLCTEREDAVVESTKLRNQLHALLMQLDPGYQASWPTLKSKAGLTALARFQATDESPLSVHRVDSLKRLAQRLELVLQQIGDLEKQISSLTGPRFDPLLELCGVNRLTAATLAGILGPGRRFRWQRLRVSRLWKLRRLARSVIASTAPETGGSMRSSTESQSLRRTTHRPRGLTSRAEWAKGRPRRRP